jgi:hypothetical protein
MLRRFDRCMANWALGLVIAARSYVIDNSGQCRRLPLSRENGQVKHVVKAMPAWAKDAIPGELRRLPASRSVV